MAGDDVLCHPLLELVQGGVVADRSVRERSEGGWCDSDDEESEEYEQGGDGDAKPVPDWLSYMHEKQPLSPSAVGVGHRYRSLLHTDKPLYKPGDLIRGAVVVLHAITRIPLSSASAAEMYGATQAVATISLINSKHKAVDKLWLKRRDLVDGSFGFAIACPSTGGMFSVQCTFHHPRSTAHHITPAAREVEVRHYTQKRLKVVVDIPNVTCPPGTSVVGTVRARRAEAGAGDTTYTIALRYVLMVSGKEVAKGAIEPLDPDDPNFGSIMFTVPAMERHPDTATLVVTANDEGVVETVSKTLHLNVRGLDIRVYPEAGHFTQGVMNGVYVEARYPSGKPANVTLSICAHGGTWTPRNAVVRTQHEGRGFCMIEATHDAVTIGVAGRGARLAQTVTVECCGRVSMTCPAPVVRARGAVRVGLAAPCAVVVDVAVYQLDHIVSQVEVALPGGSTFEEAVLSLPAAVTGVVRVTASVDGVPVAERLVYRQPLESTATFPIEIEAPASMKPGGRCAVSVSRAGGAGVDAMAAVYSVVVTDNTVDAHIDVRDCPPGLAAMVYLEQEVQRLVDARAYDAELMTAAGEPPAADGTIVDAHTTPLALLLGIQGWRCFLSVDTVAAAVRNHGDAALRALCLNVDRSQCAVAVWERYVETRKMQTDPTGKRRKMRLPGARRHPSYAKHVLWKALLSGGEEQLARALNDMMGAGATLNRLWWGGTYPVAYMAVLWHRCDEAKVCNIMQLLCNYGLNVDLPVKGAPWEETPPAKFSRQAPPYLAGFTRNTEGRRYRLADTNAGTTALHLAAELGLESVVTELMHRSFAMVTASRSVLGYTMVDAAACGGSKKVLTDVLEAWWDERADGTEWREGAKEIWESFREPRAHGWSPYHYAALACAEQPSSFQRGMDRKGKVSSRARVMWKTLVAFSNAQGWGVEQKVLRTAVEGWSPQMVAARFVGETFDWGVPKEMEPPRGKEAAPDYRGYNCEQLKWLYDNGADTTVSGITPWGRLTRKPPQTHTIDVVPLRAAGALVDGAWRAAPAKVPITISRVTPYADIMRTGGVHADSAEDGPSPNVLLVDGNGSYAVPCVRVPCSRPVRVQKAHEGGPHVVDPTAEVLTIRSDCVLGAWFDNLFRWEVSGVGYPSRISCGKAVQMETCVARRAPFAVAEAWGGARLDLQRSPDDMCMRDGDVIHVYHPLLDTIRSDDSLRTLARLGDSVAAVGHLASPLRVLPLTFDGTVAVSVRKCPTRDTNPALGQPAADPPLPSSYDLCGHATLPAGCEAVTLELPLRMSLLASVAQLKAALLAAVKVQHPGADWRAALGLPPPKPASAGPQAVELDAFVTAGGRVVYMRDMVPLHQYGTAWAEGGLRVAARAVNGFMDLTRVQEFLMRVAEKGSEHEECEEEECEEEEQAESESSEGQDIEDLSKRCPQKGATTRTTKDTSKERAAKLLAKQEEVSNRLRPYVNGMLSRHTGYLAFEVTEGFDVTDFSMMMTEAESNLNDLSSEFCMYQDATAEECGCFDECEDDSEDDTPQRSRGQQQQESDAPHMAAAEADDDDEAVPQRRRRPRPTPAALESHEQMAMPSLDVEPAPAPPKQPKAGRQMAVKRSPRVKYNAPVRRPAGKQQSAIVRCYAHARKRGRPCDREVNRSDFTETLLFVAGRRVEGAGKAIFAFRMSDLITSYRVQVRGVTLAGQVGEQQALVTSSKPFFIDFALPVEVQRGDVLHIPVVLVNGTGGELKGAWAQIVHTGTGLSAERIDKAVAERPIAAGARPRKVLKVVVGTYEAGRSAARVVVEAGGAVEGWTLVDVDDAEETATDEEVRERLFKTVALVPSGYTITRRFGGCLAPPSRTTLEVGNVRIPEVLGTPTVWVGGTALHSVLSDVIDGYVKYPMGCFEQLCSGMVPMLLVLKLSKIAAAAVPPPLVVRCQSLLRRKRGLILSYRNPRSKGFTWFPMDPDVFETAPVLSAQALTVCSDMLYDDTLEYEEMLALVEATRAYTMDCEGQCDEGWGWGYTAKERQKHPWLPGHATVTAWVMQALMYSITVELGDGTGDASELFDDDLYRRLLALQNKIAAEDPSFAHLDAYALAYFLLSFTRQQSPEAHAKVASDVNPTATGASYRTRHERWVSSGSPPPPPAALDRLVSLQRDDGSISADKTARTWHGNSGAGQSLELTSIAAVVLMSFGRLEAARNAMGYVHLNTPSFGRLAYGSTTSTTHVLGAICTWSLMFPAPATFEPWAADIVINGTVVATYTPSATKEAREDAIDAVTDVLVPNADHTIQLKLKEGCGYENGFLPMRFAMEFVTPDPKRAMEGVDGAGVGGVQLALALPQKMHEHEVTMLGVEVANTTTDAVGMVLVRINLPGGVVVDAEHVREQINAIPRLGHYELAGRELTLYCHGLAPAEHLVFDIRVMATHPGVYGSQPSQCYPYYKAADVYWAEPLQCEIAVDDDYEVVV